MRARRTEFQATEPKDWLAALLAQGHSPAMAGSEIDMEAWVDPDLDYHNGPLCRRCGEQWCQWCVSMRADGEGVPLQALIEPCQGGEDD